MKKFIALLPMKRHSQRVPNKNIKNFAGKPLFYWILDSLLECDNISSVVINTDSREIANLAKKRNQNRIHIIERPKKLIGNDISMNKIIKHDLSVTDGEFFIQTHATNPILKSNTIQLALNQFTSSVKKFDSIFSVTQHQTRLYDKDGAAINHNPNNLIPTQELDPIYEENSNFYIFSKNSFQKTNRRIGTSPQMYIMDKLEAFDIDTIEEFKIAESYINSLKADNIN